MRHSAAVHFEAEYLLHVPPAVDDRTLLVLTLHGYGSNPEVMLRLSAMALGEDAIIASLRAPNQHYLSSGPLGTPAPGSEIGYNWGTVGHAALNIELHHEIVRTISGELRQQLSGFRRGTCPDGIFAAGGAELPVHRDLSGGGGRRYRDVRRRSEGLGRGQIRDGWRRRFCISRGPRTSFFRRQWRADFPTGCGRMRRTSSFTCCRGNIGSHRKRRRSSASLRRKSKPDAQKFLVI